MKQLIKKILKEESLKHNLKQQIKDYGWVDTSQMVNGSKELAKLAFNNDPMGFLHMFDDLDMVQRKLSANWTLFKQENGNNLMLLDKKIIYISYGDIWSFLTYGFGLRDSQVRDVIKVWLGDVYHLRGITIEAGFDELFSHMR